MKGDILDFVLADIVVDYTANQDEFEDHLGVLTVELWMWLWFFVDSTFQVSY